MAGPLHALYLRMRILFGLLAGGGGALASYLAAHVLLCLVPAFFIAGALSALVPKGSVTRFLGRSAPKAKAHLAAALAGSVLAVCSCTIVPLFAGIYKKGAGIGPAVTFLFFAPAANILALAYTGAALGADLAVARFVLSLVFAVAIGLIMAVIFRQDDAARAARADDAFAGGSGEEPAPLALLVLMVLWLLAGTLKLPFLTDASLRFDVPWSGAAPLSAALERLIPFDPARGEEGLSVQGLGLIALLGLIAGAAWRGLGDAAEAFNRWTWATLALVALTLALAALRVDVTASGLSVGLTGRLFAVLAAMAGVAEAARRSLDAERARSWLAESWQFVRQIFPLLVVGVFAVGVVRPFIRPEWVQAAAGANTVAGNLAGVVFGVFMYFPTLVEVPVAKMFLSLGMHRGPLLAYLLADPELSLQSILVVSTVIGRTKAWTYVAWVALFSLASGLGYGAWVDGAGLWRLGAALGLFVAALAAALWLIDRTLTTASKEGV
jgi:uncharacterized membrane protein YraQ (UPF0718 family)